MTESEDYKTIARWMLDQLRARGVLYQSAVVTYVRKNYGGKYMTHGRPTHQGIQKEILTEFRKLTPDDVVWSRTGLLWRKRRAGDPPGKRAER